MKSNYQFSFNPNLKEIDNKQEVNFITFLKDLFPYLTKHSATFCLLIIQALLFLLSIHTFTITPFQNKDAKERNIFAEIASNFIYLVVLGRLGSQYEVKLGRKYYLSILIVIQIVRFVFFLVLGLKQGSLFITNSPTLLSLYVLSLINIKKWQQNEASLYKQQQKAVQNYDLLDLNDTVIKLKTNQNAFMYQSFTNKQFYFHNINHKEQKVQKTTSKQSKKHKKSSKFIETINQQEQQNSLKLFKCVFYHFIIYSNYAFGEFTLLLVAQLMIYLLMVSKALKRLNLT